MLSLHVSGQLQRGLEVRPELSFTCLGFLSYFWSERSDLSSWSSLRSVSRNSYGFDGPGCSSILLLVIHSFLIMSTPKHHLAVRISLSSGVALRFASGMRWVSSRHKDHGHWRFTNIIVHVFSCLSTHQYLSHSVHRLLRQRDSVESNTRPRLLMLPVLLSTCIAHEATVWTTWLRGENLGNQSLAPPKALHYDI